jgi:hypothetical protein
MLEERLVASVLVREWYVWSQLSCPRDAPRQPAHLNRDHIDDKLYANHADTKT